MVQPPQRVLAFFQTLPLVPLAFALRVPSGVAAGPRLPGPTHTPVQYLVSGGRFGLASLRLHTYRLRRTPMRALGTATVRVEKRTNEQTEKKPQEHWPRPRPLGCFVLFCLTALAHVPRRAVAAQGACASSYALRVTRYTSHGNVDRWRRSTLCERRASRLRLPVGHRTVRTEGGTWGPVRLVEPTKPRGGQYA